MLPWLQDIPPELYEAAAIDGASGLADRANHRETLPDGHRELVRPLAGDGQTSNRVRKFAV